MKEKQLNLLIVEDDEILSSLIGEHLEDQFNVKIARSCSQAQEIANSIRFDLALIDVHLPDGNGISLIQNFILDGESQVIVMTSDPNAQTAISAMKAGAIDCLIKPFEIETLDQVIKKVIKQELLKKRKVEKRQITIRLDSTVLEYFKKMAAETGISYQNLLNVYLRDCTLHRKKIIIDWGNIKGNQER